MMYNREPVKLTRDCEAVVIPAGHKIILPEGTEVRDRKSVV